MKIPCLSLWQPWASLIGRGKSIETRDWRTTYRGPLAIHAAKKWTPDLIETARRERFRSALERGGIQTPHQLPLGAVVAVCRLANVHITNVIRASVLLEPGEQRIYQYGIRISYQEYNFGDYSEGRFAWFLEDIHLLDPPIPMRGQPGLFQVELPELEVRP